MNEINEGEAALGFSKQSLVFDAYDEGNAIIQYKRCRVREHVLRWLKPSAHILELNAGTGIDAIWFAGEGFRVHATDIAPGMQAALGKKVDALGLSGRISRELCSFTQLDRLRDQGPYDCVFSNFAGLNCTEDLRKVLESVGALLKPGGQITLVLLPPFCFWESLLAFKGRFRTAARRLLAGRRGASSHVEGHYFRCWYYWPGQVMRWLGPDYELLELEGLCTIVPPSYIEGFAERHPRWYDRLRRMEAHWAHSWPWRSMGDYYILSVRKAVSPDSRQ